MLMLGIACLLIAHAQEANYVLFNSKGKKVSYKKMLRRLQHKDVVLFGELHDNAIAHQLEFALSRDLAKKRRLNMGAEMFEQDNQEPLTLYVQGKLSAKGLDSSARLWKNYPTDYAPLVNFARDNNIPFVATNIPRRYASMVAKGGFEVLDTLSQKEKSWMAPLPVAYDGELPGYKNMLAMMPGHGGEHLPKAQAIKDATMAYFILKNYTPGNLFLHFNGAYHSDNHEGIVWYLHKNRPGLSVGTLTTVTQKDIHSLLAENNKADFIICLISDK